MGKLKTTITTSFPKKLGNPDKPVKQLFYETMLEYLHYGFDPMFQEVVSRTPHGSISSMYWWRDMRQVNRVGIEWGNKNPQWKYIENSSGPQAVEKDAETGQMVQKASYFPPYFKGAPHVGTRSVYQWAIDHGRNPWWVAWRISIKGTKGNYIVANMKRKHAAAMRKMIIQGRKMWIKKAMGMD